MNTAKVAGPDSMDALAVRPGHANSLHRVVVPRPALDDVPDGAGVLVRLLRLGLDGTDRDIIEGRFGTPPDGSDTLIVGHENLGIVEAVGPAVPRTIQPGVLVVSTVRRPGHSFYDHVGMQDFTTDTIVMERGINRLHGFLSEWYVEDARYVVPLASSLTGVGVLLEPLAVVEKGIHQAYAIQRRLRLWRPDRAAVIGAGSIGLLAALVLRLRGLDVTVYSRRRAPYRNSEIAETIGAHYVSAEEHTLAEASDRHGPFDLMFEASGSSPLAFQAAASLGANGVLVLASVTDGHTETAVDTDTINMGFVAGNKVMVGTVNASRDDFERGVVDLLRAEAFHPGWLDRLLTTPIDGLRDPAAIVRHLTADRDAIKVFVEVGGPGRP